MQWWKKYSDLLLRKQYHTVKILHRKLKSCIQKNPSSSNHSCPVTLLCKTSCFLFSVLCRTLMRISSLCSQSLWFWKRFSSFQMFSSRSAWVDASPRVCWSNRERSDIRVTFSISTSWRCEDTWERETGEGKRKRDREWEIDSGCWFTDPSAKTKSPNRVSFTINHYCQLGPNQQFNAEQMLVQLPALTLVVYSC